MLIDLAGRSTMLRKRAFAKLQDLVRRDETLVTLQISRNCGWKNTDKVFWYAQHTLYDSADRL